MNPMKKGLRLAGETPVGDQRGRPTDVVRRIGLPTPEVRGERERARFRLHLVHKRTSLKNRVHAILFQHGLRAPVADLFGVGGRRFLDRCRLPEPWRSSVAASLYLVDVLEEQIDAIEGELRRSGPEHRYLQLLMSAPGIGWVLGYTIAAEIGDVERFPAPAKLVSYTGLCPRGCVSRARSTGVVRSPSTGRPICAGR